MEKNTVSCYPLYRKKTSGKIHFPLGGGGTQNPVVVLNSHRGLALHSASLVMTTHSRQAFIESTLFLSIPNNSSHIIL